MQPVANPALLRTGKPTPDIAAVLPVTEKHERNEVPDIF